LLIPPGGHAVLFEYADAANAALLAFLAAEDAPRP
jgi:hypothetical protein